MVAVLIVNEHERIDLLHVVYLILGDRIDLHFVEDFHECAVRCFRSGLDDHNRLFEFLVLADLFCQLVIFSLIDLTFPELLFR